VLEPVPKPVPEPVLRPVLEAAGWSGGEGGGWGACAIVRNGPGCPGYNARPSTGLDGARSG
jgi:hypothetical protein